MGLRRRSDRKRAAAVEAWAVRGPESLGEGARRADGGGGEGIPVTAH